MSKIIVNNLEPDTGISTVTVNGNVEATKFVGPVEGNISGGTVAGSTGTFSSNVTIDGNLGVAGTITYEDVARVDATGISTFREGLNIGPLAGIALTAYKDGSIRTSGIVTAASLVGDGSGLTGINTAFGNSSVNSTGIITATALVPTTGQLSHRNLVINGQFDIWQRGTDSGSKTASGYFSADRWKSNDSGGTYQITRQAFTVGQTDVPSNPKYYMRFAVTTGNNNVSLGQRIEGVDKVQGQVTLSFWAKGTNPNGGTFDIINRQDFGSGGSVSNVVDTSIGSFSVTASWVKKTFTFTPPSISGKTLGTTHSGFYECQIFRQPSGDSGTAAYTIDIANVQLEFGPVATPFEHRTFHDDLYACKRYFQFVPPTLGEAQNTTNIQGCLTASPPMRAAPTCAIVVASNNINLAGSGPKTCSSIGAIYYNSTQGGWAEMGGSSFTQYRNYYILPNCFSFSSEL